MNFRKLIIIIAMFQAFTASAQDEDESDGKFFKAENCFTGGSVTLSFGNNVTLLGVNPHFGYTFFNFIEAAVSVNFNYITQRDYQYVGDKLRQTVTAPGAFIRIFPLKFLFAQALYEHSFMRSKYIYATQEIDRVEANSVLVGGGYAGGRQPGQGYYYLCILWDVGKDKHSPYLDFYGRSIPILRAGMNIPLFQKRASRTD